MSAATIAGGVNSLDASGCGSRLWRSITEDAPRQQRLATQSVGPTVALDHRPVGQFGDGAFRRRRPRRTASRCRWRTASISGALRPPSARKTPRNASSVGATADEARPVAGGERRRLVEKEQLGVTVAPDDDECRPRNAHKQEIHCRDAQRRWPSVWSRAMEAAAAIAHQGRRARRPRQARRKDGPAVLQRRRKRSLGTKAAKGATRAAYRRGTRRARRSPMRRPRRRARRRRCENWRRRRNLTSR